MNSKNKYAVIMAGGVGSRFWPVSTRKHPKQFLDILGTGKSLIRQTFERFAKDIPTENIYVVSNQIYKDLVKNHIPELADHQILSEPSARNTAPCIALANLVIGLQNPDAVCVVAPSDHLILNESEFLNIVNKAMKHAHANNQLLCIGIKPHRPDTGYGYIQYNENDANENIYKVKTFTEKPSLEIATQFIESGDFLWNAGIFVWSIKNIEAAFKTHLPEVQNLFDDIRHHIHTEKQDKAISNVYEQCTNISIDYGIMEKSDNVSVIPGDFGWSDLGTWASLYDVMPKDDRNNAVNGQLIELNDSSGNMVFSQSEKLLVINGANDLIVVDSDSALLICARNREQEVKTIVSDLKFKFGDKYL